MAKLKVVPGQYGLYLLFQPTSEIIIIINIIINIIIIIIIVLTLKIIYVPSFVLLQIG
jgi:hypothetical protein